MRKPLLLLALAAALLPACRAAPRAGTLVQVSTIDALLVGVYDGSMSCRELVRRGDFGIGTFERLDGEMIVLGGEVFQVKADGKVYRPSPDTRTPFAAVCAFEPGSSFEFEGPVDFEGLKRLLDGVLPNKNLFYAIRIDGAFARMKTRSVPAQQKPYPPLAEVTKHQPVFRMENVAGTIVGLRCPPFVKGVGVPGCHLHFLSADRSRGGHVLDFSLGRGTCAVDRCRRFVLLLPGGDGAFGRADLGRDRGEELERVEK
jgi:acetolactate decarboxylase